MELLVLLLIILAILLVFGVLLFFWSLDSDVTLWCADLLGRNTRQLNGKVIWITGASSGIGESVALRLAKVGAKLILSGRNEAKLHEVKAACVSNGKTSEDDILCLPFDLTNIRVHDAQLKTAISYFEKVDILVNNAGRSQRALFNETQLVVDQEMFDVNVFSTINLSRLVMNHWYEKNVPGHVVVVSSLAGISGAPNSATYSATKHALHGYFETIRMEAFSRGIKVTILCPGPVFSNLVNRAFTATPGQVAGIVHDKSNKRMETSRCAHLVAVAIVNQLTVSWICQQPILTYYYLNQYMPGWCKLLLPRFVTLEKINRMREGTNSDANRMREGTTSDVNRMREGTNSSV